MRTTRILITGANGQVGTELTIALAARYGSQNIIATDRHPQTTGKKNAVLYQQLDVLDQQALSHLVKTHEVNQVYHLAATLSASGETSPLATWHLNMQGLLNILEVAREAHLERIFWPSSIAVFGPTSPRNLCAQHTVIEPASVYGISKQAGEQWCNYYFNKYQVDVRSIRFPGLISYTASPGGGTTDYAVDMHIHALDRGFYNCYLRGDTYLPMMYMPDAVRATIELMEAPPEIISIRTAYNLSAMSFSPEELAREIQSHLPGFQLSYRIDYRQQIADNWPNSVDDIYARKDWGWHPKYNLKQMVSEMLKGLKKLKQDAGPGLYCPDSDLVLPYNEH